MLAKKVIFKIVLPFLVVTIGETVNTYMVIVKGSCTELCGSPYPQIIEESNSIFAYKEERQDSSPVTFNSSDKLQSTTRILNKKNVLCHREFSLNPWS
jgi:hypothetical protein